MVCVWGVGLGAPQILLGPGGSTVRGTHQVRVCCLNLAGRLPMAEISPGSEFTMAGAQFAESSAYSLSLPRACVCPGDQRVLGVLAWRRGGSSRPPAVAGEAFSTCDWSPTFFLYIYLFVTCFSVPAYWQLTRALPYCLDSAPRTRPQARTHSLLGSFHKRPFWARGQLSGGSRKLCHVCAPRRL